MATVVPGKQSSSEATTTINTNLTPKISTIPSVSKSPEELEVERIEADRLQTVLAGLTSDQIDYTIDVINKSKFSQDEIEADIQQIKMNCRYAICQETVVHISK